MRTIVIKTDPRVYDPEVARPASEAVRAGQIIVYPTETFYGLGASAFSAEAVEKIYSLKGRDRGKPLSVVVADLAAAEKMAAELPAVFHELAARFWPGPLTLVVKAKPIFPAAMLGPAGTVAMRVPGSAWLRGFLGELSVPLTATSANLSGEGEIANPAEVIRQFDGLVAAIIDGGRTAGGRPSTIVDLTSTPPKILREGAVPSSRLRL
jgi:tRNA threonylcarbamoyl adenosine modification protein (Sua5/YciO/YrdC/YwlC family)